MQDVLNRMIAIEKHPDLKVDKGTLDKVHFYMRTI